MDESIIPEYAVHSDTEIKGFFGEYRFLSNFYPCSVWFKGLHYPSSEHAYQAAKWPEEQRKPFTDNMMTAGKSKKLGKQAGLDREKWKKYKYDIMSAIVFDKFYRNLNLRAALKHTKVVANIRYLEELNAWGDADWGVNVKTGLGENNLGKILMKVRDFWT